MRVGVLGSGQLGKMLALAGRPLDIDFIFYGPDPQPCAAGLGEVVIAEFSNAEKINYFLNKVDVVTAESEHIPTELLASISKLKPVYAQTEAIAIAQNRDKEKQFLQSLDIPLAKFTLIDDADSVLQLLNDSPNGIIIKTCLDGYDGKGQVSIAANTSRSDIENILSDMGSQPLVAEQRLSFDREVSLVCVRNPQGDERFYQLTNNLHADGILRRSVISPDDPLFIQAKDYATRVLDKLEYVGVMCFEFFDCDGQLITNEIAPRVHNSGHLTIEGAITSQFENHVRAICNMPLGATELAGYSVMYNLIGDEPDVTNLLSINGSHVHIYGKAARANRKLGHVTFSFDSMDALNKAITTLDKTFQH